MVQERELGGERMMYFGCWSEKEPRKLSNRRGGDLFPSLPGDAVLSRCWKTQGLA